MKISQKLVYENVTYNHGTKRLKNNTFVGFSELQKRNTVTSVTTVTILGKRSSKIVNAYPFTLLCIVLRKTLVTIKILVQKNEIFLIIKFFVLSPENEFLIAMACFLFVKMG